MAGEILQHEDTMRVRDSSVNGEPCGYDESIQRMKLNQRALNRIISIKSFLHMMKLLDITR